MFYKNANIIKALILLPPIALAGSLDSPAPPGDPASAMYPLSEICNRMDTGAPGAKRSVIEVTSGPGPGGCTLNDVMEKAPVKDNGNGVQPGEVTAGKQYWGLTDNWGPQTGTMPNQGAITITPTTTDQPIAGGYHNGSGVVKGDPNLSPGNIRGGVPVFGVDGDGNVVNTSSGDAVSGELTSGKRAWVDGVEITGTMPNQGAITLTPTTSDQPIAAGYHNGSGVVKGVQNLAPENIRAGVTILGITGTFSGTTVSTPTPSSSNRYTDNGNGTVTDNRSGLIWLKNANCFERQNWETAMQSAANLANGQCGLSDGSTSGMWRLPTKNELEVMIDKSYYNPALSNASGTGQWTESNVFSGVRPNGYWSSSTYADHADHAWNVYLGNGYVSGDYRSSTHYVWPVRGGK
ncbi:MAG: hypothetical protein DRQ41_00150 [Gammaproteobacteria bacterium]|nr:MAG: hypothetical protein DRQ41_00150 [Gammaproteobacteria bacterium]